MCLNKLEALLFVMWNSSFKKYGVCSILSIQQWHVSKDLQQTITTCKYYRIFLAWSKLQTWVKKLMHLCLS